MLLRIVHVVLGPIITCLDLTKHLSLSLFLADCWWPQLRLKLTNFMLRGSSLYELLFRRCIYSRIYSVSDFEYWIMQISNYVKSKGTTWEVNFCWFSLRRSLRQGQLCFFVGKVRSRFRFKMFHFLYRVEIGRSIGTYKLLWHMLFRKKRFQVFILTWSPKLIKTEFFL